MERTCGKDFLDSGVDTGGAYNFILSRERIRERRQISYI